MENFFNFASVDDYVLNKSTKKVEESVGDATDVYSSSIIGEQYMLMEAYENFLSNKIANEQRLIKVINSKLNPKYAINEAKLGDQAKSGWNRLVDFIKEIVAKFLEQMNGILLSNKKYLEKYKDTILKRKPKDSLTYEYTGDYSLGLNRIRKTMCPQFAYSEFKDALEGENNDKELFDKILSKSTGTSGFTYVDADGPAGNFKSYFIGGEKGKQSGNFSNLEPGMADIYDFCINFDSIKAACNKDIQILEQNKGKIEAYLKEVQASAVDKDDPNSKNYTDVTTSTENIGGNSVQTFSADGKKYYISKPNEDGYEEAKDVKYNGSKVYVKTTTQNASTIFQSFKSGISYIKEDGEQAKTTSLTIGQSASANTVDAADKDTVKGGFKQNDDSATVEKAVNKWNTFCRALITAKLTACQKIATDFMAIIRAHVRSYGGKDIAKDEEVDRAAANATRYTDNDSTEAKKQSKTIKDKENNNG